MKAYVFTSGAIFGLLAVAHVGRVVAEGLRPLSSPWFIVTSLVAAALCGWAWRLLRTPSSRDKV